MFAGGALIGVGIPLLLFSLSGGSEGERPEDRPAPGADWPGPAVAGPGVLEQHGREGPATSPLERRLDELRAKAAAASDDFGEVRTELAAFVGEARGTPVADGAKEALAELDARYDRAVEAAFVEAREAARALLARGEIAAAASGLRSVEARFGDSRWFRAGGSEKLAKELAAVEGKRKRVAANLVRNPGFEQGTQFWDDWGNPGTPAGDARTGTKSLRIGPKGGGRGQKIGSVRPGDRLVFRAWARVSKKGEVGWVGVDFYDAAKKKDSRSIEVRNTSYEEKTQTVAVPPNMASTVVWAWKNDGVGGFLFVDDYSFGKVED
jgi:hypothetical protein